MLIRAIIQEVNSVTEMFLYRLYCLYLAFVRFHNCSTYYLSLIFYIHHMFWCSQCHFKVQFVSLSPRIRPYPFVSVQLSRSGHSVWPLVPIKAPDRWTDLQSCFCVCPGGSDVYRLEFSCYFKGPDSPEGSNPNCEIVSLFTIVLQ